MPGSLKWAYASGRLGHRSSIQSQTDSVDFGALNVPAATGVQTFMAFGISPRQTVALQLGGQDAYGDGTAQLAASDTTRSAGVWPGEALGVISNIELASFTLATGAFVAYAATLTLMVALLSASDGNTPGVLSNLMTAALALNTIAFPWTQLSLTSIPAGRQVLRPDTGVVIANALLYYAGDVIVFKFSNTAAGAVTVAQGNVLGASMEMV